MAHDRLALATRRAPLFSRAPCVCVPSCGKQVHAADSRVLLYPIAGLSASAIVGAFAIFVHRMSEPVKRD